jgi:hypothetical protein
VQCAFCVRIGLSARYAKIVPERGHSGQLRVRAFARGFNMVRKSILAAAATAATSFLPPSSFAKKLHKAKEPPCSVGQACTDKPDKVRRFTGWVTAKRCSYEGKMYQDVFPRYTPGGTCPAATCKSKKKK